MSSHLCQNKSLAKLGDLLWSHGDARLCTIYPQVFIKLITKKYFKSKTVF